MIRLSSTRLSSCALACALALAGCVLGGVEGDFVPLETPAGDASCGNGAIDGSESDVDCGGGCSPCSDGPADPKTFQLRDARSPHVDNYVPLGDVAQ